ncbi:MAG: hypothetical protein GY842_13975 [bacterium]|nr:hypothetical protein [bacterium]
MKLRIHEACPECHSVGMAVVGFTRITEVNPRHNLPGLVLLAAILIAMLLLGAWFPVADLLTEHLNLTSALPMEALGFAGIVIGMRLAMKWCPVRVLLCPDCRKAKAFGFGRALPLHWLERVEPVLRCTKCEYSLVGVVEYARCPECEHPFPEEWLKITAAADPNVKIEYEVVESY